MRVVLLSLISCLCLSCRPEPKPPQPEPAKVWNLDARTLYNSYRDHSERWTGQTLRIVLPALNYICEPPGRICWHSERDTEPDSLVFECTTVPADNRQSIEVIAVSLGAVEDGKLRANGTKFYVKLRVVSVSAVR